jgi:hypothetical protein
VSSANCPHCAWPIHGQHHVDEAGVSWHLGCWEKQEKAAAEARGRQESADQFGLGLPHPQEFSGK